MNRAVLPLGALRRAHLWLGFFSAGREESDNGYHAEAAVRWMAHAADRVDGSGIAHSLHFARGWLGAYPETTGYIVPTLLLAAQTFGCTDAEQTAKAAWHWLCKIQRADGAFCDMSGEAQVFDTGQILIGANFLSRQGDEEAREVAGKCARWLMQQQSDDGSFTTHAYNNKPHAYYSRVGAALLEAGQLLELQTATEAGMSNLKWTLRQQRQDGWFEHMSFADHPPYSHTIVYTLEGLLAGYRLSGDRRMLTAVILLASALRDRIAQHGGVVRSQYREGLLPVDEQICVTGLCQWSALCFRLERLGVTGFLLEARRSLSAAKRLQLRSPFSALDGALPGSVPLSGRYMRFALPNWGVKFFLDALIESNGEATPPVLI